MGDPGFFLGGEAGFCVIRPEIGEYFFPFFRETKAIFLYSSTRSTLATLAAAGELIKFHHKKHYYSSQDMLEAFVVSKKLHTPKQISIKGLLSTT